MLCNCAFYIRCLFAVSERSLNYVCLCVLMWDGALWGHSDGVIKVEGRPCNRRGGWVDKLEKILIGITERREGEWIPQNSLNRESMPPCQPLVGMEIKVATVLLSFKRHACFPSSSYGEYLAFLPDAVRIRTGRYLWLSSQARILDIKQICRHLGRRLAGLSSPFEEKTAWMCLVFVLSSRCSDTVGAAGAAVL